MKSLYAAVLLSNAPAVARLGFHLKGGEGVAETTTSPDITTQYCKPVR